MKKVVYACIIIGLFVSGCKKDENEQNLLEAVSYAGSAPECLFKKTKVTGANAVTEVYEYDIYRRVVSITQTDGLYKTTYTYKGDTMSVVQVYKDDDKVYTSAKYLLNEKGFVTTWIEGNNGKVFYTYNQEGYLIKQLFMSGSGEYMMGTSYQYANGNKISSYSLDVDFKTGIVKDSLLSATYSYYTNLEGKTQQFYAWIQRDGMGNKNELKYWSSGSINTQFEYKIGDHDLPSSIDYKYNTGRTATKDIEWICK